MRRVLTSLALVVTGAAAGCGGGGEAADPGATTPQTPTAIQTVTVPDTAQFAPEPTGGPQFEITLKGEGKEARAGEAWTFTVTAVDANGKPASATAKMRVWADGTLVDTLGWFPFEGRLTKTHRWPRVLQGKKVVLQAEVEGAGGTQRANWPVKVAG